ncbi:cell envelope integrity protein TolA [Rhizobium leguminosarum]|uniref:cell envelope integrity protein TolA n=1 Tax=Rhizobium leguminosarum TaxID=384 RepID=UPI00102FD7FC|nr:cell envelope integrity protein TolA [Rhizobium leguminosarum]TAU90527.1 hypothetical protein ELI41_19300 [Rhizobium leguminosarum]TAV54951.1 hypothetical protein ELI29_18755 [Rhizobium leguminosarum]
MARNPLHFAKSLGIYAALTGFIVGFTFPLNAEAGTVDRGSSSKNATAISAAESNAVRDAIANHFNVDTTQKDNGSVYMTIHMKLSRDGQIVGVPGVEVRGGSERARKSIAAAGLRAIRRSAPFTMLPKDKYDAWKEVILNFDTSALTQ